MKISKQDQFVSVEATIKSRFRASVIVRETETGAVITGGEFNILADKERTKFSKSLQEEMGKRVAVLLGMIATDVVDSEPSDTPATASQDLIGETDIPWPEPVDGVSLLTELEGLIRRHVAIADDAVTAIILWIIHTHALDAAQFSPILTLLSPVPRCGKTTVLQVLELLCRKGIQVTNLTPAGLFRTIQESGPTLLLDEADTYLYKSSELIGLLNAGHSRLGAYVIRIDGDSFVPKRFSLWAAKAIAAIGTIAGTLLDRSIVLPMRRKAKHEHVERIRGDRVEEFIAARRKISRWVLDNLDALKEIDPPVPNELNSRAADGWRPLLQIADLIGGKWPLDSRNAALALRLRESDAVSPKIQVLSDIRDLFSKAPDSRAFPSEDIVKLLNALEESPWREFNHGKSLTTVGLAALLQDFDIAPTKIRLPGVKPFRGYWRASFSTAFDHYLPPSMEHPEHMEHHCPGAPDVPGLENLSANDGDTPQ